MKKKLKRLNDLKSNKAESKGPLFIMKLISNLTSTKFDESERNSIIVPQHAVSEIVWSPKYANLDVQGCPGSVFFFSLNY